MFFKEVPTGVGVGNSEKYKSIKRSLVKGQLPNCLVKDVNSKGTEECTYPKI